MLQLLDVNIKDHLVRTPLMPACYHRDGGIARRLCQVSAPRGPETSTTNCVKCDFLSFMSANYNIIAFIFIVSSHLNLLECSYININIFISLLSASAVALGDSILIEYLRA